MKNDLRLSRLLKKSHRVGNRIHARSRSAPATAANLVPDPTANSESQTTNFESNTATLAAAYFLSNAATIAGVFSLSGSASQQQTVKAALARCTFPFERMKPGLRQAGLNSVKISWQQMGEGSPGWASTGGEIAISDSISGLQAQRTAILELGHAVDFFYMTPDMRKEIVRLWHPDASDNHDWFGSTRYRDQNGEAFSALFLWAFTDEEMWFDAGYSHKPSRELAAQVRAILVPATAMK